MYEVEHEQDAEIVEDPAEHEQPAVVGRGVIPASSSLADHGEHQQSVAETGGPDESEPERALGYALRASREGDESNADDDRQHREYGGREEIKRTCERNHAIPGCFVGSLIGRLGA